MFKLRLLKVWVRARERAWLAISLVLGILAVCLFGNAATYVYFDDANWGDAWWYSVISTTTIGYGDFSAQSFGARIGTVLFIVIAGLGTFSLVLGLIFDRITDHFEKGKRGMGTVISENHVVIINCPSPTRVRDLVSELRNDPHYADRDVVLVADGVETNPLVGKRTYFIAGNPVEEDTLTRAKVDKAAAVLVLATNDPATSDAVASAVVGVVEHLNRAVYTVVECLHASHRHLFVHNHCDSVICAGELANNLMVQELQDHGVGPTIAMITSNRSGATCYTAPVEDGNEISYQDLAKGLLDADGNLLAVVKGDTTHTTFKGLSSNAGDQVVYIGQRRKTWKDLVGLIPGA